MNTYLQTIDDFCAWLDVYVERYYSSDEELNAMVQYKHEHSVRTRCEMRCLALQLGWSTGRVQLAEIVGLLHDVGRFEQIQKHQTYNDHRSVDHGQLGAEILMQKDLLRAFSSNEQQWMLNAIRYHNARYLPRTLTGDTLRMAQLIRDADKLDIFRSCSSAYERYRKDPQAFAREIGYPMDPYCTPEVIAATLRGESVEYCKLRTVYDCMVMQLGWIFDLNFPMSVAALHTRGHVDEMIRLLPDWPQLQAVCDAVTTYMNEQVDLASLL